MNSLHSEQRAKSIFLRVVELGGAQQRDAVALGCSEDPELHERVCELLEAHRSATGLLGLPLIASPAERGSNCSDDSDGFHPAMDKRVLDHLPGCRLGRYELLRLIGAGGMGLVYEAREEGLRRNIALKILRPGAASVAAAERFAREGHVLGRLRHNGIAQVYEAGVASVETAGSDGVGRLTRLVLDDDLQRVPFLAMELIHGKPIDEHCRAHALDLRSRVALFTELCEAINYAHARHIVHRDLKPANVLIDEFGRPKVLDFGVARLMDGDGDASCRTQTGELLGTLAYMSPEQVSGNGNSVDARTDVYALGVMLYELITGRRPHEIERYSLPEVARLIRDEEAPRLGAIDARLRGDLDLIAARALDKNPLRRYATAGELGADLRRYLNDEPIVARPPSALYQFGKFARRNRALVIGLAATFSALSIGLLLATMSAISEARQRAIAETRTREAERIAYSASIAAAAAALQDGNLDRAQKSLVNAPGALRGWEWDHLHWASRPIVAEFRNPVPLNGLIASPDRSRLAALGHDRSVTIWELALPPTRQAVGSSESIARLRGHFRVPSELDPKWGHISADNQLLMLKDSGGAVRIWDIESGTPLWVASKPHVLGDFSPDSRRVVLPGPRDGSSQLFNARTGAAEFEFGDRRTGDTAYSARFHPDGRHILNGSYIYSIITGKTVANIGQTYSMALSPDWTRLVRVRDDFKIEALPGRETLASAIWNESWEPQSPRWSRDGKAVLVPSSTGLTKVFDNTLAEVEIVRFPRHVVESADGSWMISWQADGRIDLREAFAAGITEIPHPPRFIACSTAISADARKIAVGDWGHVRVHSGATGEVLWCVPRDRSMHSAVSFCPQGKLLATGSSSRRIAILDAKAGDIQTELEIAFVPRAIVWTRSTRDSETLLIVAGSGGQFRVFKGAAVSWAVAHTSRGHRSPINALAVSPDGKYLASGSGDGVVIPEIGANSTGENDNSIRIWSLENWECVREIPCSRAVTALAYSPDGRTLLTACRGGVSLYDVSTFAEQVCWSGSGVVRAVAWHPSGNRFAAFDGDTIRLWDVVHSVEAASLHSPVAELFSGMFSPDGASLVAAGRHTSLLRLDTRPGAGDPRDAFYRRWAYDRVSQLRRSLNATIASSLARDETLPDPARQIAARTIEATGDHLGYLVSDAILLLRTRSEKGAAALAGALARLERACDINPHDAGALFLYALSLYYSDRHAEALIAAREFVHLAEMTPTAFAAPGYAIIALCEARLGDSEAISDALSRATAHPLPPKVSLEEREILECVEDLLTTTESRS